MKTRIFILISFIFVMTSCSLLPKSPHPELAGILIGGRENRENIHSAWIMMRSFSQRCKWKGLKADQLPSRRFSWIPTLFGFTGVRRAILTQLRELWKSQESPKERPFPISISSGISWSWRQRKCRNEKEFYPELCEMKGGEYLINIRRWSQRLRRLRRKLLGQND